MILTGYKISLRSQSREHQNGMEEAGFENESSLKQFAIYNDNHDNGLTLLFVVIGNYV